MKIEIVLVVLVAVLLTSCIRESSTANEKQIVTQTSPVSESVNAVMAQTLPSIEPASGVSEQRPPTTIEHPCANAAQDSPNSNSFQRWIYGSWVNVQATPTADATVLAHLSTNTPVRLSDAESKADYCEINWGNGQHGFIACRLLGARPLTIEDLGPPFILVDSKPKVGMAIQPNIGMDSRYLDWIAPNLVVRSPNGSDSPNRSSDTPIKKPNPNYSPRCAFWIEPNFKHLLDAGAYFEDVMLTPEQKDLEDDDYLHRDFTFEEAPPLPRFKIEEFEAMKDLMKKGLIARTNSSHPRLHRPAVVTAPGPWNDLKNDFLSGSLKNIDLRPVKVSHFKSLNEIGRPSAGTEELSNHFQIPYSIAVLSGPSWEQDEEGLIFKFGSWDMGVVRLFLTEPLQEHTISNHGVVGSQTTSVPSKFGFSDSTGDVCKEGFQFGGASIEAPPAVSDPAEPLMMNAESGKKARKVHAPNKTQEPEDSPLFYFYTREPLVVKNARVLRGKVIELPEDFYPYEYASTKYIDINEDNVFDFAVWEGMRPPTDADGPDVPSDARPEPNLRVIFANISGQWYLMDADELTYICGDAC